MEKSEYRVLIKHYFLRKKTVTETKERLDKYYGNSAPSISMLKKWFTEFRCGRTSTSDAKRSGRPKEVITPDIVDKIHGMILDDRRMKVCEVAEAVGISTERVHHILHEYLDMRKLSARWVPRLLTLDHKRNRVTTSKECLFHFFLAASTGTLVQFGIFNFQRSLYRNDAIGSRSPLLTW